MAEKAGFIRGFLRGVIDPTNYRQLLADYHHIYSAMEEVMTASDHPAVKQIFFPELMRLPAIEQDLIYFAGPAWSMGLQPSAAARAYANRIREIAKQDEVLLVAHAYTRYLGDLSGGQILKKILVRSLHLPEDEGVSFYEFPSIIDHVAFKQRFRQTLDQLPINTATQDAIITEANLVFGLNTAVFDELSGSAWESVISMISHTFATPARAA